VGAPWKLSHTCRQRTTCVCHRQGAGSRAATDRDVAWYSFLASHAVAASRKYADHAVSCVHQHTSRQVVGAPGSNGSSAGYVYNQQLYPLGGQNRAAKHYCTSFTHMLRQLITPYYGATLQIRLTLTVHLTGHLVVPPPLPAPYHTCPQGCSPWRVARPCRSLCHRAHTWSDRFACPPPRNTPTSRRQSLASAIALSKFM
jgi:hypothetical protein